MPLDKDQMRVYLRERYHKRRNFYLEKLGGVCANCGSSSNLEFDHIDPESKECQIGSLFQSRSDAAIEYELAKCQLLCEVCHKEKSDKYMTLGPEQYKHGTPYSYRHKKCRCEVCKSWNTTNSKKYRDRRKARE